MNKSESLHLAAILLSGTAIINESDPITENQKSAQRLLDLAKAIEDEEKRRLNDRPPEMLKALGL